MGNFKYHIGNKSHWFIIGLAILLSSCVRRGLDLCNVETQVYVRTYTDRQFGKSTGITSISAAHAYIFDSKGKFLYKIELDEQHIVNQQPFTVSYQSYDRPWVVIWVNEDAKDNITDPSSSHHTLTHPAVTVAQESDYALPPDNLFWGMEQLDDSPVKEVIISPKNARTAITVRGISGNNTADDYRITIEEHYKGYQFGGTPLKGDIVVTAPGMFTAQHELVTPEAINIIHYPVKDNGQNINEYINVKLLKKGSDKETLIAEVTEDLSGNKIIPQPGKTTNILIDISNKDQLIIYIEITDWNEIHQWTEW